MQTNISILSGTKLWEITATAMLIMEAQIVTSKAQRRIYTLSHKHSRIAHIAKRNYNQQQTTWQSMSHQAAPWLRQRQQRAQTLVIKSKAPIQYWIKTVEVRLRSAAPIASWKRSWCRLDQPIHHGLSKIKHKTTRAQEGIVGEEVVNKKKSKHWNILRQQKITVKLKVVAPIQTHIADSIRTH